MNNGLDIRRPLRDGRLIAWAAVQRPDLAASIPDHAPCGACGRPVGQYKVSAVAMLCDDMKPVGICSLCFWKLDDPSAAIWRRVMLGLKPWPPRRKAA